MKVHLRNSGRNHKHFKFIAGISIEVNSFQPFMNSSFFSTALFLADSLLLVREKKLS